MHFKLLVILMISMSVLPLSSQELEWSVDMNAVFHNREGESNESPNQTFLFTRITPQIGVSLDSARHRVMGGVTWYQPMNDNLSGYKVLPSIYYQYCNKKRGIAFKFGVIPNELNSSTPRFLRSDSINFVQPNIKGVVFSVDKPHFWFYSWLDWRQIQTQYKRESFDVTGQVGWRMSKGMSNISLSTVARYNHLAKSKLRQPGEGVVDHLFFYPQVSFQHQWKKAFLKASAGVLLSCDRDRIVYFDKWRTSVGFLGQVLGTWRWLSLSESIYAGDAQMPFYEKYGSLLYHGDQFYHNKFYSRTDLTITFFNKDYVNIEGRLTYHITDKATAFWQQLAVRFYIDQYMFNSYKKKNKKSFDNRKLLPSQF